MRYHAIEIDRGNETFAIRNKYRFVRKIGSGAYGTVCSVVDVQTGEGIVWAFKIEGFVLLVVKHGGNSHWHVNTGILKKKVVAIKKLRNIFDKTLITKRCLREIKLLQHFNGHPRIIDIRELDIVDHTNFNEVYLAQQCCDTTLADVIHSAQPLETVHHQWFLYQILTGINYIHSADVSSSSFVYSSLSTPLSNVNVVSLPL